MAWLMSRRQVLGLGVLGALGLGSGCGTILYPERRGQTAGPLDLKVVALDAIGLLFFFVPGVIAFAVDFATGAIYLPTAYSGAAVGADRCRELVEINVPRQELTHARIEQVVSKCTVQPVQLLPGQYQTQELKSLEQFWAVHDTLTPA